MKDILKRHNLIYLTNNKMIKQVVRNNLEIELNNQINIPGIIKRQEIEIPDIEIGISLPFKRDGVRYRAKTTIKVADVDTIKTPYDIIKSYQNSSRKYKILNEIIACGVRNKINIGLFGSLALEIETGLSYWNQDSDIDIVISIKKSGNLNDFYREIINLEAIFCQNIDVEVEVEDGFAIKLKEYYSNSKTIIKKGIRGVELVDKDDLKLTKW